jgi:hypothetical protein
MGAVGVGPSDYFPFITFGYIPFLLGYPRRISARFLLRIRRRYPGRFRIGLRMRHWIAGTPALFAVLLRRLFLQGHRHFLVQRIAPNDQVVAVPREQRRSGVHVAKGNTATFYPHEVIPMFGADQAAAVFLFGAVQEHADIGASRAGTRPGKFGGTGDAGFDIKPVHDDAHTWCVVEVSVQISKKVIQPLAVATGFGAYT